MDMTLCPQCGEPTEVQWRDVLESTDGPIEHAKILCVNRHWFLLPVADLTCPPPVIPRESARRRKSHETAGIRTSSTVRGLACTLGHISRRA